jgi:hypothetical protein
MSHITGGSAFGLGDAVVDVRRAVLLDEVNVVLVGVAGSKGAGRALAMELNGRVNKSQLRSSVLYVFDEDGAAAIISELFGLAGRISPAFLDELLARVEALPRKPGS